MCIPSIRCGLPFSEVKGENRTLCSLITRISLIAIGGIMLTVGILALSGISGFNALGMGGGAAFIVVGGLSLFAGLCLRTVKESSFFPDLSGLKSSSTYREAYCLLEDFLASNQPDDLVIRNRLKKELAIIDLNQQFTENFADRTVRLLLTLRFESEIRDDELLFQLLKLIYLPANDLLARPLEEVKGYNKEQRNILCFRLVQMDTIPTGAPGTLGAFLCFKDEVFSGQAPYVLYPFLTKAQVIYCLQNTKKIDQELVDALFPYRNHYQNHFIDTRSNTLLAELPIDLVNKVLPYVKPELLLPLLHARGEELNIDLVTEDQIFKMLSFRCTATIVVIEKIDTLPIEIMNRLIPKMDASLLLIPNTHLQNQKLDLTSLSVSRVRAMFSTAPLEASSSRQRIGYLHNDVLIQIWDKMSDEQRLLKASPKVD